MLWSVACSQPDLKTDLRPEGDPEILTVMQHSGVDFSETAVYCHYVNGTRDVNAPGFVGDPILGGSIICPEAQSDFVAADLDPRVIPDDGVNWAVRVQFDELLDPSVEQLKMDIEVPDPNDPTATIIQTVPCDPEVGTCYGTIADTNPVRLTCGATNTVIGYDGYYVPNGNRDTFPLGPSLFVNPSLDDLALAAFPTGTPCKLAINDNVVDKDGNKVPTMQNSFDLKIADLALLDIFPADHADAAAQSNVSGTGFVVFSFNAGIDDTTLDPTDIELLNSDGSVNDEAQIFVDDSAVDNDAAIELGDGIYILGGHVGATDATHPYFVAGSYTARLTAGAMLAEINGGTMTNTAEQKTRFKVPYAIRRTSPSNGSTTVTPTANISIFFNGDLSAASVAMTELQLKNAAGADVPFTFTVTSDSIVVDPTGNLPSGSYRFTIPAGSAFDGPNSTTATLTTARVVAFTVP